MHWAELVDLDRYVETQVCRCCHNRLYEYRFKFYDRSTHHGDYIDVQMVNKIRGPVEDILVAALNIIQTEVNNGLGWYNRPGLR